MDVTKASLGVGTVTEENEKLKDFHRDPSYEHRVVFFLDVLGWRGQITRAGADPTKLGKMRRLILRQSRLLRMRSFLQVRTSTFSDNVVISQPFGADADALILQLAILQVGAALQGFLIRGGGTVGDIVHDDEVVFGPGLNRAYELESQVARTPRIVLDDDVVSCLSNTQSLVRVEDGLAFIDPFTLQFVEYLHGAGVEEGPEQFEEFGIPRGKIKSLKTADPRRTLRFIFEDLKTSIRAPIHDKEYEKLIWLFDRIATQFGLPLASSYPRVKPEDVV